jgi:tetratricopeptide (TPR) repeat protein
MLVARDEELADLTAFVGSQERWRWIQGAAFAGKTALLAWFALHPPDGVDVAACFLRRTASRADAGYVLSMLTSQLAHLAHRPDDRPTSALYERVRDFRILLEDAAQACRQRGHRLVVLVDGLDEDQTVERGFAVARWLPDATTLPDNAWLLVASRAGVPIPVPDRHPLTNHIYELTVSVAASELEKLAKDELDNARSAGGLVYDVLGLLAAAIGGLTVTDLTELIHHHGQPTISSVQVADIVNGSLVRSVSAVADPEKLEEPWRVFAHEMLLDHARALYAYDCPGYYVLFDRWAQEYQQQGWPPTTPPYLLRPYTRQLASQALDPTCTPQQCRHVIEALYQIVTHPARGTLLLERTGNPAVYDQEITTTQRLLIDTRERSGINDDLELMYRLAVLALTRRPFIGTLAEIVVSVSSVWAQAGRFLSALAIAAGLEDVQERTRALTGVVAGVAQAGQMGEAIKVARGIEDPWARALAKVAGRLVEAGEAERAVGLADEAARIARSFEGAWEWARVLDDVAETLAKVGQAGRAVGLADEAARTARSIEEPGERARALDDVAETLAKVGQAERAVGLADEAARTARSIEDSWERARVLAGVAETLAKAGEAEEAIKVARSIEEPWQRARALTKVAGRLVEAGLAERAVGLADEAARIATGIEDLHEWAQALADVAGRLAEAGQAEEAIKVAHSIEEPRERAQALAGVAGRLAEAGQAEEAIKVARSIEEPWQRARALTKVAGRLPEAGLAERAVGLADEAAQTATGIGNPSSRAWALASVAETLAKAGEAEEAIKVARSIEEPRERARALTKVAGRLAEAGLAERAVGLADEAARTARSIEEPGERARALDDVAGRLVEGGEAERAVGLADEAARTARSIEEPGERARVLAGVAETLAKAGEAEEAIKVARSIEEPRERARALADVADRLVARQS